jgi:hypothetical protein
MISNRVRDMRVNSTAFCMRGCNYLNKRPRELNFSLMGFFNLNNFERATIVLSAKKKKIGKNTPDHPEGQPRV